MEIYFFLVLIISIKGVKCVWDKPNPLTIDDYVYVQSSNGLLRGFSTKILNKTNDVYVFKKIPFAKPPLGKLRFAPLEPLQKKWGGVYDATEYGPACMSNSTSTSSPQENISEDCIHTNIFTSSNCFDGHKKCDVLIYIHGGNFLYDSAVMFNDQQIVNKYVADDVIFVIPAFRLGLFGFLDLGSDSVVKRNLGFHDIIFAIEWIKKEIPNFGGNSHRITIMGNSGGANAIIFLMAHQKTMGSSTNLFNQAIISSPSIYLNRNSNLRPSFALLKRFCGNISLIDEIKYHFPRALALAYLKCMQNVDSFQLIAAQAENEDYGLTFDGVESSLDFPYDTLVELLPNIVPSRILISTTLAEFYRGSTDDVVSKCRTNGQNFNYKSKNFFNACKQRYLRNGTNLPRVAPESVHAMAHVVGLVNRHNGGETFMASFRLENHTTHADDMLFFFGLHWMRNKTLSAAEKLMDSYYPEMIKNFVHQKPPDKRWKPVDRNGAGFFILDFKVENETITTIPHYTPSYYDPEALQFWISEGSRIEYNSTCIARAKHIPKDSYNTYKRGNTGLNLFYTPKSYDFGHFGFCKTLLKNSLLNFNLSNINLGLPTLLYSNNFTETDSSSFSNQWALPLYILLIFIISMAATKIFTNFKNGSENSQLIEKKTNYNGYKTLL